MAAGWQTNIDTKQVQDVGRLSSAFGVYLERARQASDVDCECAPCLPTRRHIEKSRGLDPFIEMELCSDINYEGFTFDLFTF